MNSEVLELLSHEELILEERISSALEHAVLAIEQLRALLAVDGEVYCIALA